MASNSMKMVQLAASASNSTNNCRNIGVRATFAGKKYRAQKSTPTVMIAADRNNTRAAPDRTTGKVASTSRFPLRFMREYVLNGPHRHARDSNRDQDDAGPLDGGQGLAEDSPRRQCH